MMNVNAPLDSMARGTMDNSRIELLGVYTKEQYRSALQNYTNPCVYMFYVSEKIPTFLDAWRMSTTWSKSVAKVGCSNKNGNSNHDRKGTGKQPYHQGAAASRISKQWTNGQIPGAFTLLEKSAPGLKGSVAILEVTMDASLPEAARISTLQMWEQAVLTHVYAKGGNPRANIGENINKAKNARVIEASYSNIQRQDYAQNNLKHLFEAS